jgi:hypothetical protein
MMTEDPDAVREQRSRDRLAGPSFKDLPTPHQRHGFTRVGG